LRDKGKHWWLQLRWC